MVWRSLLTTYLLLLCDAAAVIFNKNCRPSNCSQGRRYLLDSYFDCSIGGFLEWEEFKNTHQVLESYEQNLSKIWDMNPPSISAVGFYLITDRNNVKNNPNLNITFRLPRGNAYDTKALLVKFIGTDDPRYPELIDPYYKDNPRHRIFNFPLYKTPEQDKIHPREIVYGCFMGLDCQAEKRVYLITLTAYTMNRAYPGASITYHFTVYTTRYFSKSSKVTIAVAPMYRQRTIHVVFEPVSEDHASRHTYYNVNLMEIGTHKLQTVKIRHGSPRYEHEFPNVNKGSYFVEVEVRNCTGINPCPVSQSGIVEVEYQSAPVPTTEIPTAETALPTAKTSPVAGMYAVIGTVSGVVLVLVLLTCFMVSKDHKPKVYILSLCPEGTHANVSTSLRQCINPLFDTTVISSDKCESVKGVSSKVGFQNQDKVIIATKCHHIIPENFEKICEIWTRKRSKKITFICFSQNEMINVSRLCKCFKWYGGCAEMIKYIQDKRNGHCLNIFKQFRPRLNNIFSENSEEFNNFQRTIASTQPMHTPPQNACPVHPYRQQDDCQQPLLYNEGCSVHPQMSQDRGYLTQSLNGQPISKHFDHYAYDPWTRSSRPIKEHQFDQEFDHCQQELGSPITSSNMGRISQKMLALSNIPEQINQIS